MPVADVGSIEVAICWHPLLDNGITAMASEHMQSVEYAIEWVHGIRTATRMKAHTTSWLTAQPLSNYKAARVAHGSEHFAHLISTVRFLS